MIKPAFNSGFLCFWHVFVSYAFCLHTPVWVRVCVLLRDNRAPLVS